MGLGTGSRRSAQWLIRRSDRAIAAKRWRSALRANELAEAAINRASADGGSHPEDERVLASLHYNRAAICEALGDPLAAKRAAGRAWQIYDRLDPTDGRSAKIAEVLAPVQVPVVVTDYRTVRAAAEQHQRTERQVEEAIAHAADALIRYVRLEAQIETDLFADQDGERKSWAENIRKRGKAAVSTYRELLRVGHNHGPADLSRVQAQHAAILAILDGPVR